MLDRWQQLKIYDRLTIVFFALLNLLILFFARNVPQWGWHFIRHLIVIVAIWWLVPWVQARESNRFWHFIRRWYLIFAYPFIYWNVGRFIHLIFPRFFDEWIIRLETALFGTSPNLWIQHLDYPLITELMHLAYASYWFTIPVGAAIFYFHRRYREYDYFLSTVTLTFYLSYLLFILFPVAGPRVALAEQITASYQGILLTPVIRDFVHHSGLLGGAFPSSHVAVAVVVLCFLWVYFPRTGKTVFLPVVIGLSLGTIFGQFHYVTDVVAGLAMGCALGLAGVRRCRKETEKIPQGKLSTTIEV